MCVPKGELSLSCQQPYLYKGRGRQDKGMAPVTSVVPSLLPLHRQ